MSNVHEFPPRGPSAGAPTPPDKLVLEELQKIADFLAVARCFGFAVVATPAGQKLLHESQDPRAAAISASVCPIERDPWSVHNSRNAT